jgi:hypothetical protein
LLVIIGRSWLTAADRQGKRRLDDADDFVRLEIATALKHGVRMIPVLVDGATMPAAADLPRDIQALVRRNAVEISHQRFATDTRHLAHALVASEPQAKAEHEHGPAPAPVMGASVAAVAPYAPVSTQRALAVAATVLAIISSGAIAGLWLAPQPTDWWFLQIGSLAQVWVVLNVMVGPGLAAKIWLPRLSALQFLGILGATFAALVPLYALPQGFQPILLSHFPADQEGVDPLLWAGFVTIPVLAGFTSYEYGLSVKWLELLKEIAPGTTRVAVLRDPVLAAGIGQFAAVQAVASSFAVELIPIDVRDASEIERAVASFARSSNGGLIVTSSAGASRHRDPIIRLAARHKLPAVYFGRFFVTDGGLISYGPDFVDQNRQAAAYVDRILKGEEPADLPVQAPTKYDLVMNLKTAKALGLTVAPTLLARADEVIE